MSSPGQDVHFLRKLNAKKEFSAIKGPSHYSSENQGVNVFMSSINLKFLPLSPFLWTPSPDIFRVIIPPRGKKPFLLLLTLCLGFACAGAPSALAQTAVAPTVGDGLTLATAYQINELGNLVWLGERAAANDTAGKYYTLMNDIDASVTATWNDVGTSETDVLEGFKPIGTYSNPDTTSFRGFFDGNGKKIMGLTINRPDTDYVGLFGYVRETGSIKNLTMERGWVTGEDIVGGIVGDNYGGRMTNCIANIRVTGRNYVGGIVGNNVTGIMTFCYATGAVNGRNEIGGLIGTQNSGTIKNCFATGTVTGTYSLGGLVGSSYYDSVANCFATGKVTGIITIGGLIGRASEAKISACYWDKEATGWDISAGGTGATAKTTAEMKQQATFAGWDFASVWEIAEGQSYPYLRFARPPFRLSVTVDGSGSLTLNPSGTTVYAPGISARYDAGTTVTMDVTVSDPRYRFAGWIGPVANPTTTSTTVLMDTHKSVIAHLELNAYRLTTEAVHGSVAKSPDQTTYTYGTVVTLTAIPDEGYLFAGWTGAVADRTAVSTTLVMNGHQTVSARFLRSYEIRTLAELQAIATGDLTGYYTLMNDIDASDTANWNDIATTTATLEGFRPIGISSSPDTNSFQGVFDGNGKKITGVTINRSGMNGVGLFGCVGKGGEVRNLILTEGSITGSDQYIGGLVGYNRQGAITSCTVSNTIKGKNANVGGLIGYNYGGSVTACSASGVITGTNLRSVGGLVGENTGSITNCSASGTVTGSGSFWYIGGLVGKNSGSIANSFASGPAEGSFEGSLDAGGLAGRNSGSIQNSFASGTVVGNAGSSLGANLSLGGLVGYLEKGTLTHCFAIGAVTGQKVISLQIGGMIGNRAGGKISACYWDMETSGQTTSVGGTGVMGKTTAEMKRKATFQPGGGTEADDWDFTTVWGIVEGQTYPYLRATSAPPLFRLDVSITGQGSVTLDPPGGTYAPGTTVTLTATAAAGYHFADWTGGVTNRDTTVTTVVLDTHKSVTAHFLPHYEIRTLAELQSVATGDLTGYYTLMNDIDASDTENWNDAGTTTDTLEGFQPIGIYSNPDTTSFRGVFDGNGKKILGLTINRSKTNYVGLFGCVSKSGEIRNLTLEGEKVTGATSVGGLAGVNAGTIVNCSSQGSLAGATNVGGLAGLNSGTVRNGFTTGMVKGTVGVGGLTGVNNGTAIKSVSSAFVTGTQMVGGLIGNNSDGTVTNCSAHGVVTSNSEGGGLIGINQYGSTIQNSFATGAATGRYSGGLVGYNSSLGVIAKCFATGTVTGTGPMMRVGGLVGSSMGGGTITNSFATGTVTGTGSYVGGLSGFYGMTSITACYWDMETTGQTSSSGSDTRFGKTTAEMKRQATFQPGGGTGATDWDFTSVWGIFEGETYPFLRTVAPLCRLSVAVEGAGTVAVSPSGTFFAEGTEVTLTARPAAGSRFVRWTGDVPVGAAGRNPLKFTIQKDTSLTVRFEPAGSQPAMWMVR